MLGKQARITSCRLWLAVWLMAAAAGCSQGHSAGDYRTQEVRRLTLESRVVANGIVNPVTTVLVGSQVSGMIKELFVDFNSPVKRGQVIARIDPALFEARVAQTRAALKQAQAEVAKAQANLEQATLDFRRYQELWRQNLVARNDLDKARTTYEASQAELHAAQARVSQNAAALKDAETNLAYATIISPVDGVVVSRSVDVGQTVASSFQTPTLFTIAQDLTRMQVETSVDEAEVGKVTEGQSVTFTVDAHPETTFTGQVNQVRLAPTTVQNVVTYTVVIQAGNPQLLLKPGMTATVRILVARQENVLAVPNAALRFHPKGVKDAPPPTAGPAVWRLGPQRQPQAVPVKLGITDGVWTEIKEGAVKEGDRLIIGRKETGAPTGTGYMRGPV